MKLVGSIRPCRNHASKTTKKQPNPRTSVLPHRIQVQKWSTTTCTKPNDLRCSRTDTARTRKPSTKTPQPRAAPSLAQNHPSPPYSASLTPEPPGMKATTPPTHQRKTKPPAHLQPFKTSTPTLQPTPKKQPLSCPPACPPCHPAPQTRRTRTRPQVVRKANCDVKYEGRYVWVSVNDRDTFVVSFAGLHVRYAIIDVVSRY